MANINLEPFEKTRLALDVLSVLDRPFFTPSGERVVNPGTEGMRAKAIAALETALN